MIYFVEQGDASARTYQFMDERLASALIEMFQRVAPALLSLPLDIQRPFWVRLHSILTSARGIGWGYFDGLLEAYYDYCAEEFLSDAAQPSQDG